jgi:hypothetical protein
VTNLAKHNQNQLDPFWNAILAGAVVALFLLAILPSSKIDYIYRVKAVATQNRLEALQSRIASHTKSQLSEDFANRKVGLRFVTSRLIETTPPKATAVLSTQQSLPLRALAEVTFLADRKYLTDEIQLQLEEISLANVKSDEILQLEQRKRTLEWELTSAQHLSNQLAGSRDTTEDFKVVSTNSVDESVLRNKWQMAIASKQELYDQLVDQIRTASLRASGFVAVAGKPKVSPRVTGAMSISTVVAFFAGALTSCVIFILLRSTRDGHSPTKTTHALTKITERKTSAKKSLGTSQLEKGAASGIRLASRISKLGIPYLGAIESSSIAVSGSTGLANDNDSMNMTNTEASNINSSSIDSYPVAALPSTSSKSASQELNFHREVWSAPLQRSLEWLLILWMTAVVIRFFSDDVWRSLVLQSPLTGLAKLFSGIA